MTNLYAERVGDRDRSEDLQMEKNDGRLRKKSGLIKSETARYTNLVKIATRFQFALPTILVC